MIQLITQLVGKVKAITPPGISPTQPSGGNLSIQNIIGTIANWVLYIGGAIAFIYLIYGGILYITAGGDAEKATKGRTAIINAVIGIIIIFLSLVIISWVTGGSIFNPPGS